LTILNPVVFEITDHLQYGKLKFSNLSKTKTRLLVYLE